MAPPVPVYNHNEIRSRFREQLENPAKYECQLKSLTQHECTFRTFADRSRPPEFICLPFKRIFQRCLVPSIVKENGKKKHVDKWVNIEVTNSDTNRDLFQDKKYKSVVAEFLSAEEDFQRMMK
ncbi:uncharacterized protein CANTADRAFT_40094, partial [Suhomyces tanzawaensis NRRL Y-17324]